MKKYFSLIILFLTAPTLYAYEACGANKEEALSNLSSQIISSVSTDYQEYAATNSSDDSVERKVASIIKVSSHLTLVNQKYTQKEGMFCVSVKPEDQRANAKKFLNAALALDTNNLPQELNAKIDKLEKWLHDISEATHLTKAFLTESQMDVTAALTALSFQDKKFHDLYTQSLAKADSLVFKACATDKENAYSALNESVFKDKTQLQDDEGILDKSLSFFAKLNPFAKKEQRMLDLFNPQVAYVGSGKQTCAVIKKSDLLQIAQSLNQEVMRFSIKDLHKDPKERYTQINAMKQHLNVTKALLELFESQFSSQDFKRITTVKKALAQALENTFPQFVRFTVLGDTQNLRIKVGEHFYKANERHFLKSGEYSYRIMAKDRCAFEGSFTLELQKDVEITKDFSERHYPKLTFFTKEGARISVAGKVLRANMEQELQQCEGEVKYLASFDGQEKEGRLSLSPNMSETIEIKFLKREELDVLNNVKTRQFKAISHVPFSDTLTPVASKNLHFVIGEDVSHGSLALNENGSFTYTSDETYVGIDSFKYRIKTADSSSSPIVANIYIERNTIQPPLEDKKTDENLTRKSEEKTDVSSTDKAQDEEERYQRFKAYVNSQEQNMDKLKKLQEKYPKMFERLLQEKLSTP